MCPPSLAFRALRPLTAPLGPLGPTLALGPLAHPCAIQVSMRCCCCGIQPRGQRAAGLAGFPPAPGPHHFSLRSASLTAHLSPSPSLPSSPSLAQAKARGPPGACTAPVPGLTPMHMALSWHVSPVPSWPHQSTWSTWPGSFMHTGLPRTDTSASRRGRATSVPCHFVTVSLTPS